MFYFTGCKNDPTQKGIIPKSFEQIFSDISRSSNVQYLVRASYLEIYQEEIRQVKVILCIVIVISSFPFALLFASEFLVL
jgi:hypothetical protein